MSKPPAFPPAPPTLDAIIQAFDDGHKKVADFVRNMRDEQFSETVQFPVGPGQMRDWPKIEFLWMTLSDQIHHRGQFSIYLRMADGMVPSIYGPTADEPWM